MITEVVYNITGCCVCYRHRGAAVLRVCTAEVVKEASAHQATKTSHHQLTARRNVNVAKPFSTARSAVVRFALLNKKPSCRYTIADRTASQQTI